MRTTLLALAVLSCAAGFAQQGPIPSASVQKAITVLKAEGLSEKDLAELRETDSYTDTHNGIRHTWFKQQWQGIDIFNSEVVVHQRADGEIVAILHRTVDRVEQQARPPQPGIAPEEALRRVLEMDGMRIAVPSLIEHTPEQHRWRFAGEAFGGEPPFVELVWLSAGDVLLLAWNVNYQRADGTHWWNVRIDASTGKEIERNDWVASTCGFDHAVAEIGAAACAPAPMPAAPNDLRVYPLPYESPNHGARAIRNAPWTAAPIASPYGWYDTNGAPGAEYMITRGNNVYASEDMNADNIPGFSPDGGTNLDFDFPINLANAPSTNQAASITNLFYWTNLMHDIFYRYGFDEVSGNFQSNNYGRGGVEGDFLYADGQDGSGTNNGNFSTPPDGTNPRLQVFNWTLTTPNRDGCLDNGLVTHEYGHGISNRLVGGPSNANTLTNQDQPGEGWSDWIALMVTMEPGDLGTDVRGLDTYLLNQPTNGNGIRPFPYTTNHALNNLTYASTNNTSLLPNAHGNGTMWCSVLWDLTWNLIDLYGYSPDLYNGNAGNNIALQLVIAGLKYTPSSPGFVDARNGILMADQINNGGAYQNIIWSTFAARGLGFSASEGNPYWRTDQVEAFDLPSNINVGVRSTVAPLAGSFLDCQNGQPITVKVRNNGLTTQSNFNVSYRVDGGPVNTQLFAGTLIPGASSPVTFTMPLTFASYGAHTIQAWTSLPSDQYHADDTLTIAVNWQANVQLPFSANAEDALALPTGWSVQNPDGLYTWSNVSLAMGANCAATRAFKMNYHTYYAPNEEDRLVSPLINLAGSAGTRLQFHHAYAPYGGTGQDDGLRVEISTTCGSTWTTLYSAFGAALGTAPQTTATWVPTACNQWLLHDIDLSAYDGQTVMLRFTGIGNFGNDLFLDNIAVVNTGVKLAMKVMLDGPYDPVTFKMRDDLRIAGSIPAFEPFTVAGFTTVGGGGEMRQANAFATNGDNAIVDWVLVELRSAITPSTIIATRAALVQRDGDVVAEDGVNAIALLAPAGNYHVAVRHRNHLGVMTASPVALSAIPAALDLTNGSVATFGSNAQKVTGTMRLLWAGNTLLDGTLKYVGANNDRDPILVRIGGTVPTNTTSGYWPEDITLDGVVKYVGSGNDRDPILVNIGGTVPTNTRAEQLP